MEREFHVQLNKRITKILENASSLRTSIPLPTTDEERRFPTPESPPVVLNVQDATLPSEQDADHTLQQGDLAASGYQRDITSDLASMTLYESTCEDFSPSSVGRNPRRKPLRNSATGVRAPHSRSPFLYKSPPQSSKSHAKQTRSAQKETIKETVRQPSSSKPEPIHTGAFGGARLKISSTSVWSRGLTSTPHGGKSSEVPAIGINGTPIKQASGATASSIGEPQATVSSVENKVDKVPLDIASSSGNVKASISRARSAPAIEICKVKGVSQKLFATNGSGTGNASTTSSTEQTQKITKPIQRQRPVSQTVRSIAKDKVSQPPKFRSTVTRAVPGVQKGTSKSSIVPKVASASGRDTRGVSKVPKDKIPIPKGMSSTSQTSSKTGVKTSTPTSAAATDKSQNTKETSRQIADKGKKKAPQITKIFSKTGSKSGRAGGMNIAAKTTTVSCVLKDKTRTIQASKATTTATSSRDKNGASPKSEENSSTRAAKGAKDDVPNKNSASASLPEEESVAKSPKEPSSVETPNRPSAIPQRRLSDHVSNAGAVRSVVSDMSNMSLGLSRPRGTGHQGTDSLPRRLSDLSDKKETPKKKPHSY